jgi:hypothetical protein
MKPNIEQEKIIEHALRSALKFKDTYDEVYDHILSAFNALPGDVDFTDTLYGIIANDFGGVKGLKKIERKHTWLAIRHFIADYLKALLIPLTSVILVFLIPVTGLFYFLIASGRLNGLQLQLVLTFIPIGVLGIAVYKFRQQVKSFQAGRQVYMGYIRQNIVAFSGSFILFFPTFLWTTTVMFCHKLKYSEVPPAVCAIVFFAEALHTFAGYKMYTTAVNLNI